MKTTNRLRFLLLFAAAMITGYSLACSPCQPMTGLQSSITGTTLTLDFESQAGWNCCYTAEIEIICQGGTFTGTPGYFSQQICHTGGNNTFVPYQSVDIDISNFCPGTYEWRVSECFNVYSAPATFVVPGAVAPFITSLAPAQDTICLGESVQLTALGTGGCNNAVLYSWTPSAGLSGTNIPNPVATPNATTTYTVTITEDNFCNLPGQQLSVEIVVLTNISLTTSSLSDTCGGGYGSVSAMATTGSPPFTYTWPTLGNSNLPTISGVAAGSYDVEVVDMNGCDGVQTVIVDNFLPTYDTDSTVVSCTGGSDGTATVTMVPQVGNITYLWNDPLAQTTQTATGLSAGTYTCTVTTDYGCVDLVDVTVTENTQLTGVVVNQIDVSCHAGSDGEVEVLASQATPPYTYSWSNSGSTTNIADDLPVGPTTVTITDALGCMITVNTVLNQPDPLQVTSITLPTEICPEDSILLQATGIGGSSPYIWTWFENGDTLAQGNPVWAQHDQTNTEYCVVLSEQCGSPEDTACTIIDFFPPISPSTNTISICVEGGEATFFNQSSNSGDVASTYWDFGENDISNQTTLGLDPATWDYSAIGLYDVTMTVTSVNGCVYVDSFANYADVYTTPTAFFTITESPTLVTNNTVTLVDGSTQEVTQWEWYSAYGSPSTGTGPLMEMTFPFEEGIYPVTLFVESDEGCRDSTTLNVVIYEQAFYAPNTFTPDGDEFNQVWKPEMNGFDESDYHLVIFNRWGQVIFESYDPNVGWDGTYNGRLVMQGTYNWKAETKNLYDDARQKHFGSINLIK